MIKAISVTHAPEINTSQQLTESLTPFRAEVTGLEAIFPRNASRVKVSNSL